MQRSAKELTFGLVARQPSFFSLLCFVMSAMSMIFASAAEEAIPRAKPAPPLPGKMYHGVYPGGITGDEDDLTVKDLREYERAVGQPAAWVYFSHNWFTGNSRA